MAAPTTFSQLWNDLKVVAANALKGIEDAATKFETTIVPVIEADVVAVLSQFQELAVSTVLQFAAAEYVNMAGNEKQGQVVTTVLQAAEAKGLSVAVNDVQMFAQQAYNAVASTLAPKP